VQTGTDECLHTTGFRSVLVLLRHMPSSHREVSLQHTAYVQGAERMSDPAPAGQPAQLRFHMCTALLGLQHAQYRHAVLPLPLCSHGCCTAGYWLPRLPPMLTTLCSLPDRLSIYMCA